MTTAPLTFGSGAVLPAEAVHVTGRRVLATIIDGLFSYAVAFFTALASGKRQRLGDMAAHTLVVRA